MDQAIAYYDANGQDATVAQYRSGESIENDRTLVLISRDEGTLLVYHAGTHPARPVRRPPVSAFPALQALLADASEDGIWTTGRGINRTTRQEEPRRILAVLHDGLVFATSHSVLQQDVAESTKEYVNKAIAKYDQEGLDATIAHYNSQDSLDGQFYLFLHWGGL